MAKSTTKSKKNQNYISKYKELKSSGLILWNVKGKRTDRGLTRWQKQKINAAHRELSKLGNKTGSYYPPKKKGETKLGYVRRINRIKRNSGIAPTDLSPIMFQSELVTKLQVKDERLLIHSELPDGVAEKQFMPINRIEFNKDPHSYLSQLFEKEFKDYKGSDIDSISPIHSHWTGSGTYISNFDDLEDFINKISGWAHQYGKGMASTINSNEGDNSKVARHEVQNAISKYDNFITGLMIETYSKR